MVRFMIRLMIRKANYSAGVILSEAKSLKIISYSMVIVGDYVVAF